MKVKKKEIDPSELPIAIHLVNWKPETISVELGGIWFNSAVQAAKHGSIMSKEYFQGTRTFVDVDSIQKLVAKHSMDDKLDQAGFLRELESLKNSKGQRVPYWLAP